MTSWKSGNALPTFDCLKFPCVTLNWPQHWLSSTTFHNNFFFFPFPSTTYTKAYKYIWYPNSGASGFKFRFMWNSYTEGNIATYQAHRIWLRLPRFNTLSQMNPFLRLRHAKEIIGGEKQSLKNFTVSGKEMYDEVSKIQAGSFYIPLNSSYTMVLTRRICLEIRSLLKW